MDADYDQPAQRRRGGLGGLVLRSVALMDRPQGAGEGLHRAFKLMLVRIVPAALADSCATMSDLWVALLGRDHNEQILFH
jgi:hypothetical protein